jgi:hypothetical protein
MSVEKIAPLGQTATELSTTLRPAAGHGFGHSRATTVPPSAAAPVDGPAHLYDSLALPLPGPAPETGGPTRARVSALYHAAATSGATILLVEGRIPAEALRHAVETLLDNLAEARGVPVSKLIDQATITEQARLPSLNDARAEFAFKGRLVASDPDGKLRPLDLYLTRIGPREWEASAYERTPALAANLFPRPTALVDLHHLAIDPDAGRVRACLQWAPPQTASADGRPARIDVAPYLRLTAGVACGVTLLALLARGPSWGAGALVVAAFVVALAAR